MLQKIIRRLVIKRHPWRTMQFDELAELYTSMSIRSLGFGMVGIFVPVYLYKQGVDIESLFWLFGWIFLLRIPVAFAAAFVIGRIGPKHAIGLSTLLFILFLAVLLSYQLIGWPLVLLALFFTASNGLFFVAYDTDFSKIKSTKHGGKELGWLYIFERIGAALGPFIGGLLASIFVPEITIVGAIGVLLASLVPLFMTNEPVRTHQRISFKGFKWQKYNRDALSMSGHALDKISSEVAWPLLIAITVFAEGTYVKLGSIAAVSMVISLFSAHLFGRFIDAKHGLYLLRSGVLINSLLYLVRPFSLNTTAAITVSAINEPVTLSCRMPLAKGFYDAGDSAVGYRIVYFAWVEIFMALAKTLYFFTLFGLCYIYDPLDVLRWSFVSMAVVSSLMLVQKFPALSKS